MKNIIIVVLLSVLIPCIISLAITSSELNKQTEQQQTKSTEFNIYRGLDVNSNAQAVYIKKSEDVYHVGDLVAVTQTGLVDQNRQELTRWVTLDEFVTTDCFIDDH